jgi:hypothetical protein
MLVGLYKKYQEFWNKRGWHFLLIGLLIVFFILFVINQFSYHPSTRTITISDIYEHFMSMLFNPHRGTEQRYHSPRRYRSSSSLSPSQRGGSGGSSKGETKCKEFVEFFFQKPFEKCRPNFLQNPVTNENLELDMFNLDLGLAIEYNGAQHYHYNSFMHGNSKDKFYNQKYRDLIKEDLCKKNNIKLIIVPYTVPENQIAAYLFEELKKLGYEPHPEAFSKLV